MNYFGGEMIYIEYKSFVEQLEQEHGNKKWGEAEKKVHTAIKQLFTAATSPLTPLAQIEIAKSTHIKLKGTLLHEQVSMRIKERPCSKAVYGIDVMLDEEWNPKILEVNFSPDCSRLMKQDSHFWENIFSLFFIEDSWNKIPRIQENISKI